MEESVNSENYFIDIILGSELVTEADKLYGVNQWILQQDNTRSQVSQETLLNFDELNINFMDDWPIIWAIMKHRLERKVVKTLEQLKIEIQDLWANLSIALNNRLIDEMCPE